VAYDGLLQVGNMRARDRVVLIDVDGLGDRFAGITHQGTSRTWFVGAMLARVLAEQHLANGEEKIGIVTPYKAQKSLIEGFLADSDTSLRAEVGTVHSFQGREFGTVIFDLVEDGQGWIADDSSAARQVFNVGITRAQHTLYLILNAASTTKVAGRAFIALRKLFPDKIEVIRAREVLGLEEAAVPVEGTVREIWEALRAYARVLNVYDEERLPEELIGRIEDAQSSIWLWSPWVAIRSRELLPSLSAAQNRGVAVHVVVMPTAEMGGERFKAYADELAGQIDRVVRMRKEHQKIIVVDKRYVFFGSMNTLSHAREGGRRETMALFDSRSMAERLLEHERTDQLARPRTCRTCGRQAEVDLRGRGRSRMLHWVCNGEGGRSPHWQEPFPQIPRGRNQR
jgi:hypothetical protein